MRDYIIINAAVGLWVLGECNDFAEAAARCAALLDDGSVLKLVDSYVELTNGPAAEAAAKSAVSVGA